MILFLSHMRNNGIFNPKCVNRNKSRLIFMSAEMFEKSLWQTCSVDPDQTAPIGAVCSGSILFASILNLSVILGSYLQQTASETAFSDAFFFLAL